jgi:predicted  nucleic acid-binding Zn-ribbon protein
MARTPNKIPMTKQERDDIVKNLNQLNQRYTALDHSYSQEVQRAGLLQQQVNKLEMQLRQERQVTRQLNELVRELMQQREDNAEKPDYNDLPY